jgi:uncharacterized protein YdhG (YjbR/CyaY superfamily)
MIPGEADPVRGLYAFPHLSIHRFEMKTRDKKNQGKSKSSETSQKSGSQKVDAYISATPREAQEKLREFRAAIMEVAPKAVEGFSYQMPYYAYKGRLAWFAYQKGYVGLYLRPPVIADHKDELAGYVTTKSAIHFPLDEKVPVQLVKKLVRARMKRNEAGE